MSDPLRKAAEIALEALHNIDQSNNYDAIEALRKALAQPEQEPVWSAEECDRVVKTLRYIQGIAERGEGRAMRDDETLEQFVLGYVKKLEQPEQEPVAWMDKDSGVVGRLHQWKNAIPLYTAPPKREWQGLTDEEIYYFVRNAESYLECAKGIEAKLKEKNT